MIEGNKNFFMKEREQNSDYYKMNQGGSKKVEVSSKEES